ncbi:hypothetical protein B6D29_00025 [Microgenomates bacterium UTCPR1]|nr:MAG: hypothetical protein B6D29_00025 [Microgenomates bacterium UTCPR1]
MFNDCKISKPWVFFDNAGEETFWLGFYSLKYEPDNLTDSFMSKLCFHGEEIGFKEHRYKNVKFHKSFHTSFDEPKQNSQIYEALISVCKALFYYKNQYKGKNTAHFFTPIVVLDGTLWSATLKKDSNISLRKTNRLVVRFDYIFGEEKSASRYESQLVEIITKKELMNLIENIEKDNNTLFESWKKYLHL